MKASSVLIAIFLINGYVLVHVVKCQLDHTTSVRGDGAEGQTSGETTEDDSGESGGEQINLVCNEGVNQSPIDIKPEYIQHKKYNVTARFRGTSTYDTSQVVLTHIGDFITGTYGGHVAIKVEPLSDYYNFHSFNMFPFSLHSINGSGIGDTEMHFYFYQGSEEEDTESWKMVEYLASHNRAICVATPISVTEDQTKVTKKDVYDRLMEAIERMSENPTDQIAKIDVFELEPNFHSYYVYNGSLLYPSCTEIVMWIICEKPLYFTQQQMEIFKNSFIVTQPPRGIQDVGRRWVDHYTRGGCNLSHLELTLHLFLILFNVFEQIVISLY